MTKPSNPITIQRLLNKDKTSPLDSFYAEYAESIRLGGGCRYLTVYDFTITNNVRLLMEYLDLTTHALAKKIGTDDNSFKNFISLKSRYGADMIYKVAKALGVNISELYVDRSQHTGERPTFRFS